MRPRCSNEGSVDAERTESPRSTEQRSARVLVSGHDRRVGRRRLDDLEDGK